MKYNKPIYRTYPLFQLSYQWPCLRCSAGAYIMVMPFSLLSALDMSVQEGGTPAMEVQPAVGLGHSVCLGIQISYF